LACVDFPAVRTTITTSLTTPSEWSSYGQGLLTNTDKKGDQVTRTFNLDYPCPSYIICWAVGDLIIYKEENTKIPVAYIAPRGTSMDNLKLTFE
jgi:aminopeptidase N